MNQTLLGCLSVIKCFHVTAGFYSTTPFFIYLPTLFVYWRMLKLFTKTGSPYQFFPPDVCHSTNLVCICSLWLKLSIMCHVPIQSTRRQKMEKYFNRCRGVNGRVMAAVCWSHQALVKQQYNIKLQITWGQNQKWWNQPTRQHRETIKYDNYIILLKTTAETVHMSRTSERVLSHPWWRIL